MPTPSSLAAVEAAGYGARVATAATADGHAAARRSPAPARSSPRRLTLPVALLAMVPPLQFAGWEWVALALSAPVVFYAGLGFHRAALKAARHAAATMDTLISLGTLAALVWSAVVLVGGLDADVYFEVAAVITTLILLGRYLEARAKGARRRRSGGCSSSARRKRACYGTGEEVLVPIERASASATSSSSGRARRWRPTASSSRASRRSTSRC